MLASWSLRLWNPQGIQKYSINMMSYSSTCWIVQNLERMWVFKCLIQGLKWRLNHDAACLIVAQSLLQDLEGWPWLPAVFLLRTKAVSLRTAISLPRILWAACRNNELLTEPKAPNFVEKRIFGTSQSSPSFVFPEPDINLFSYAITCASALVIINSAVVSGLGTLAPF